MSVAQQMDFFDHQERARKGTARLVVMFAFAVLGTMLGAYLVVAIGLALMGNAGTDNGPRFDAVGAATDPVLIVLVMMSVLVVVSAGTMYKLVQLRGGGRVIAQSLGGVPIDPSTRDPMERKVLNVVEEMAIASGVPTPPVYMMRNEPAINAFAAGFRPEDAVIGVTRGCVEQLTRDELQGVMAHEFSHILNGDMRLNIRLMGVLHGILLLGLIGGTVLRMAIYMPRSKDGKSAGLPMLVIGGGLMVVGYVGTFFGNWIKAAVSRQREFLADASAVQFTRNPEGIGGALRRIGGLSQKSRLKTPNAAEASHMFFGPALLSGMFATHPPLPERIRRIDPKWDGTFLAPLNPSAGKAAGGPGLRRSSNPRDELRDRVASRGMVSGLAAGAADATAGGEEHAGVGREVSASRAAMGQRTVRSIGTVGGAVGGGVSDAHLDRARELLASIPESIRDAAHEAYGARAVVLSLVADDEADALEVQMRWLDGAGDRGLATEVRRLLPSVSRLPRESRIPLIDLCLPALAEMSPDQYRGFMSTLDAFVRADRKLDVFEWSLTRMMTRHLGARFGDARPAPVAYYKLLRLGEPLSVVLTTLARAGHRSQQDAERAFAVAAGSLPGPSLEFLPPERCGLTQLDEAIAALDTVAPPAKRDVVNAMAACVWADGSVGVMEAELFRAIADGLGVPVPPIVAG